MKRQWIKTTVAEPFPVFFSHPGRAKLSDADKRLGPFYAAGSSWYSINTPKNLKFEEFRAAHLRQNGFTVTVETVIQ